VSSFTPGSDRPDDAAAKHYPRYTGALHRPCACKKVCGDVAESKDHALAVCKGLSRGN
jgi:hypothetical protein